MRGDSSQEQHGIRRLLPLPSRVIPRIQREYVVQTSIHDSCHHCKRLIRKAFERLEQVVVGFKDPRSRIMKEVVEVVR